MDASHLTSFVTGHQEIISLKLGELWAIPIMLRLALIENLRRVAAQLNSVRKDRDAAENWANEILQVAEKNPSHLIIVVGEMARSQPVLTRAFVTEFLRRIQEKSPSVKLAVGWIEERLAEDSLTVGQLVQSESQYQAATQVSVGNSIAACVFSTRWTGRILSKRKASSNKLCAAIRRRFIRRWISRRAIFTATPSNASRASAKKLNLKSPRWPSPSRKKMLIIPTTDWRTSDFF